MIIFGVSTKREVVAALILRCSHCHATAAQRLVNQRRWFTLFFLPIFPFQSKHLMECVYCGAVSVLTSDQAERFKVEAAAAEARRVSSETLPGNPAPSHGPI
ncbi:MAG: zinc ribbon domain-containing protein [Micrococcales bacterium]|nr:zinc ribbon domain-containing protein [Micrococcales bacterium]